MTANCKPFYALHTCWLIRNLNQSTPVVPLKPIPVVGEPFSQVIIDCVRPLPKTKAGKPVFADNYVSVHKVFGTHTPTVH